MSVSVAITSLNMNFEENKTDSTRDILTSLENKLKQATDNQKLNKVKKEITFVQHLVIPKIDYKETGEKWLQKSNKIGVFLNLNHFYSNLIKFKSNKNY